MATIHSYARFSHPSQEYGDSERRQIEDAEDYCKRHGHKLSDLKLFDKGKSGFRGNKQKALAAFIDEFGKRVQPGDILLVEAVDRLGRKGIRPTRKLIDKILDFGVHIAILTPYERLYRADEPNDLGGAIELTAFAYQAHVYSALLSGRIKSWWTEARKLARQGQKTVRNKIPAWLTKTEAGFDVTDEGRVVINYIFDRIIQGIGTPTLCAELNQTFRPIARGKNGKRMRAWNHTYVRGIIRGRAVCGEYTPHLLDENGKRVPAGEPIPDYYPRVIDEERWLAAQSAIDNRSTEKGPSVGFVHLFNGLVWYAPDRCQANLYTYRQRRADGHIVIFRRLKSYKAIQRVKGASTETVSVDDFERAVLSYLKEVTLPSEDGSKQHHLLKTRQGELAAMRKRLREIDRLIDDPNSGIALKTVASNKAKAMDAIDSLQSQIRELAASMNGSAADNLAAAQSLIGIDDPETRQQLREAIKQVIQRINILPVKIGKLRRSPVACLIEIIFKGGFVRQIVLCGGKHTVSHDQRYTAGSTETLDYPDLDVAGTAKSFQKYAKEHFSHLV